MNTPESTTPKPAAPDAASLLPDAIRPVTATEARLGPLVARLTLAVVIFPHGAQKVFGWFGGYGFTGTMTFFTDTLGIPYVFGLLAIIAEFIGPLALVAGAFARVAAFGIGVTMTVAMWMVHLPHGFFMNWFGNQVGEGIEFFLLAIGLSVVLLLSGGGAYSIDRLWSTSTRK